MVGRLFKLCKAKAEMKALYFGVVFLSIFYSTTSQRDAVANQLYDYNKTKHAPSIIETHFGAPVDNIEASLTVGPRGLIPLQDYVLLDTFASFDRERIPSRVVHALGAGAFGNFTVTNDITKYCKAKMFSSKWKTTKVVVRFSLAITDKGDAETSRDDRGFAVKFYTEDGIWDLVGYNSKIFFVRDPMKFPMLVHAFLRNPVTNIKDPNMYWDYISHVPETVFQAMMFFSDIGIPDGFRHMSGFGQHAFKMVNADNEPIYVKFHLLTDQGIKNLTSEEALKIAKEDTDYATRDLYDAIAAGNFPSWTMHIQVMTFDQAEKFRWNPFDITKEWPEDEFELIEVGRLVLNENPKNYFADVEQVGFSPAHLVPGIEPSPDRMFQGRLFAYSDAQRYRLGTNHLQLPVNCPFSHSVTNYQRDGQGTFQSQGGAPNYYPNSYHGPKDAPGEDFSPFNVTGQAKRFNNDDEDNFTQPRMHWEKMTKDQQDRLVQNMVASLSLAYPDIQDSVLKVYENVDKIFAQRLRSGVLASRT